MTNSPVRANGVEVNEVADGYIVYHRESDRVHYLNHTAALVLELCTGRNRASEIVRILQVAYDLPDPPEREIAECLDQLRDEGLVG